MLSKAQQLRLVEIAQRNKGKESERAKSALVKAFTPMARAMAKRFEQQHSLSNANSEDLEQECGIAMLRAIGRFDPSRGAAFSTFAAWQMRGAFTKVQRADAKPNKDDLDVVVVVAKRAPSLSDEGSGEGFSVDVVAIDDDPPPDEEPEFISPKTPSDYWPDCARDYATNILKGTKRAVALGLWFDFPPKKRADIARELGVSRPAITKAERAAKAEITRRFGGVPFELIRQR